MKDIIEAATEAHNDAIEFDTRVAEDKLRYSTWILGVATAGFALALTQSDKLLRAPFISPNIGKWVLATSALLFLISAAAGAIVKQFVNEQLYHYRRMMTFHLKQELILLAEPDRIPNDRERIDVMRDVLSGKHGYADDVETYSKHEKGSARAERIYQYAITIQQILVAAGYLAIFACSVG